MDYFLSFLEGIITFISPCLLPMLPVYISYFAGGQADGIQSRKNTLINAAGFIAGFTAVFVLLGTAAGTFGLFVREHTTLFNLLGGALMILFGLNFMSVISIGFLNRTMKLNVKVHSGNFFSSLLFGIVFSIGWTPCVGAFLGSALMLAASGGHAVKGTVMLLLFSLGLGIPFFLSALLMEKLKSTFEAIKRNYKIINVISGSLLIILGILMMTGRLNLFLSLLTF